MKFILLLFASIVFGNAAYGFEKFAQNDTPCVIFDSQGNPVANLHDPISQLLTSTNDCPTNVFQFRSLMTEKKLKLETTLVANRGFHNPTKGSFSLFEMVTGQSSSSIQIDSGDLFFGHFIAPGDGNHLIADQTPTEDALMIEAFAWDSLKGYYNFYELRGTGSKGQWIYRGDSADIFFDNQFIHRQPNPAKPVFGVGKNMRCSACHLAGGPIMKELDAPNNDWWEKVRGLNFGGRTPDETLANILNTLVNAQELSQGVRAGLNKLETSASFQNLKAQLTLQEQLRPLFCPMEVNLQSDVLPNMFIKSGIKIPLEFFIDDRLVSQAKKDILENSIVIRGRDYGFALQMLGSRFPETDLDDADHAWLTPVKATSDKMAIDSLVTNGVIDSKFVSDVLMIDFTNPVTSATRCALLKFVPVMKHTNWKKDFIENLINANTFAATELAKNLSYPTRSLESYQTRVEKFLDRCVVNLQDPYQVVRFVKLLDQRRNEIRSSEISKNRHGQILEPGFRVIFPQIAQPIPSGTFSLFETCEF